MENSYEFMKILSIDESKKFASEKIVVIVTGTTGQDGSFMADYLLKNPHPLEDVPLEIFGGARRLSVSNHENIKHLEHESRFHLINFDLTDAHSIAQTISQLHPSYFINFAAQSSSSHRGTFQHRHGIPTPCQSFIFLKQFVSTALVVVFIMLEVRRSLETFCTCRRTRTTPCGPVVHMERPKLLQGNW